MFDIVGFCHAYNLEYLPGDPWVKVSCPWCGNQSSKGGEKLYGAVNAVSEGFTCFRCGGKHIFAYLRKVLPKGIEPESEIWNWRHGETEGTGKPVHANKLNMPVSQELGNHHRNYLKSRKFDPDHLVNLYGISGLGMGSTFKDAKGNSIDLSWRVLIPVKDAKNRTISWQARSIRKDASLRYIGCPDSDSIQSYKESLYGINLARKDIVGVVEGVFDQWRMGPGWVATMGIGITPQQIKQLSEWKRVVICFDSESLAQKAAHRMGADLASLGIRCDIVDLELGERDAGDLSEKEALEINKELGF